MAGLAEYSPFFRNPQFMQVLREVTDPEEYIGSRFLPEEETYETKFYETTVTRTADMANILSLDAELPLTGRDAGVAVSGEVADIGQAYVVSKEEMGALMDKGNAGKRLWAEKMLLGKSRTLVENIRARIEWMRWQALSKGTITYSKNGIYLTNDFGVTFRKTAATRWDDVLPTILMDYMAWVQEYSDINGVRPSVFITSLLVINTVMNDETVRKMITGSSDKLITLDELNAFLKGRQLPPMEAFDSVVTYKDVNNGGVPVTARLLDPKTGVFLRAGKEIGVQLLGPTVENEMNPGIFGETIEQKLPMRNVIYAVGSSYPKITNPKLIGITQVLA